jgi:hypothetical protein
MDEYDNLLKINNNLVDDIDNKDDITDDDIINNKNELSHEFNDDFFKYIFNNINLSRRNEEEIVSNNLNNVIDVTIESKHTLYDKIYLINLEETDDDIYINTCEDNKNNIDNIYSNNDNINNINNIDNKHNSDNEKEDNIILDFIKKIYKKIIIKCHPDKGGDKSLFIKCQEYYDNNFLIGVLYIGYKVNFILPELNKKIIEQILYEIRIIQQKIIYMKLKIKKKY